MTLSPERSEGVRSVTYCWGTNANGQVGDGTTARRLTPMPVATQVKFAQIGTRGTHTCGEQRDTGVGYCWGANSSGQLGDATTTQRLQPTKIAGRYDHPPPAGLAPDVRLRREDPRGGVRYLVGR